MLMFGILAVPLEPPQGEKLDRYLRKIADGDMSALSSLYEETRVGVYSFALSMVKSKEDAEDILQDVYLSIIRSASNYRSKDKPLAWIMTITRNLCLSKLRRRVSVVPLNEDIAGLADGIGDSENRIILNACLRMLSDTDREIVILHAVSGMKFREIAAVLEMNPSTVGSKYNRAVKTLEKELRRNGVKPDERI